MVAADMNDKIAGLHHVTAIASDPQRNLDFYVGLLGLRFVKRTVNFDDSGTYHFYFGDQRGTPGTSARSTDCAARCDRRFNNLGGCSKFPGLKLRSQRRNRKPML
jgi:catechol 2,3-dioxygenase-like lactoylglutathione lyase family enzyme